MQGFVLMNLSKYRKWRALLHRVIAKQQGKIERAHPVFTRGGKVRKGGER